MKTRLTYFLLIFATILLASCGGFDEEYFEKNSRIKLPEGYKVIEFVDDGEITALAKIQLPKDKVETFISSNGLEPLAQGKFTVLSIRFGLLGNNKETDTDIPGRNSYLIKDCGECNCWEYVVDKDTGILWAQIDYPDNGGKCPSGKI